MSVPALKQPGEAILEPTLSGDEWVTVSSSRGEVRGEGFAYCKDEEYLESSRPICLSVWVVGYVSGVPCLEI